MLIANILLICSNSILDTGSRNGTPGPKEGGGGQDDDDEDEDAIPEDLPDGADNEPQRFVMGIAAHDVLDGDFGTLHLAGWLL